MGRPPCCDENGLKKGPWTPEEDQKLIDYIQKHGHGSWRALPKLAGLNRCGKSCRLRWTNYLRPDIKRGKFSQDEEQTILNLHAVLGNKWSAIASHLPGRTDNEIKNFWNTHLKKKLIQMGFDPMTHQPRTDLFSTLPNLIALLNLKDLLENPQFDPQALRLQSQALQLAKLQYIQYLLQSTTTPPLTSPLSFQNPITEMEILNLLNSIPPELGNNINNNNNVNLSSTSQPLHYSNLLLPELSDPQEPTVPFSCQPSLNSELGQSENLTTTITNSKNDPWILPSLTDTSVSNNNGEASSTTSSYGGGNSSFWSDFIFDENIVNDIC